MTIKYTTNLGLKLNSQFTEELNFNFRKIDELATVYQTGVTGDVNIRSKTDVVLEPNSADLGGEGSGGSVIVGSQESPATSFYVFSDTIDFNGTEIVNAIIDWNNIQGKTAVGLPDFHSEVSENADVVASLAHSLTVSGNPHGVTASEVGAYSIPEADAEISSSISAHANLTHSHGTSSAIVGKDDTQTLTNKTIDANSNTISNLKNSSIDNSAAIQGTKIVPNFGNQTIVTQDGIGFQSSFTTFIRPASSGQTSNVEFRLPNSAGLPNQVLSTNGTGRLSWQSVVTGALPESSVDVGSASGERLPTDTATLGDIQASTDNGLTIKDGSITTSHLSSVTTDSLTEGLSNKYYASSLFDTDFGGKTTDALNEGTLNQYFTEQRARTATVSNSISNTVTDVAPSQQAVFNGLAEKEPTITPASTSTYYRGDKTFQTLDTSVVPESSNLYYTTARVNVDFDTRLATKTTDDVAEGSNLYYTTSRSNTDFDSRLLTKTTSDLAEGTNLYYTDSRADSAFDVRIATKTTDDLTEGSNLYYTTARSNADFDARFPTKSTSDLTEGANLYYTDARVDQRISTKTSDDISEGVVNRYVRSLAIDWLSTDGTTKVVNHSLGTTDVIVQIFNKNTGATILIDEAIRTDLNTVTLTATEAPGVTGWRVLIMKV